MSWRQKLKETFQHQTGIDPKQAEPVMQVSTMERVLDARLAEVGSNWLEPEDSLVDDFLFTRPKALIKSEVAEAEKVAAKVREDLVKARNILVEKAEEGEEIAEINEDDIPMVPSITSPKQSDLNKMAMQVILASVPSLPDNAVVRLRRIEPVTIGLVKGIGYRFIESVNKCMGLNNVNRPYTRKMVAEDRHLVVAETANTFQIWGPTSK